MRYLLPFAIVLASVVAVLFGVVVYQRWPAPTAPVTNGDRWRAMCRVEVGPSKRDQDDCFTKHALGAAFAKSSADYDQRLRDAAR